MKKQILLAIAIIAIFAALATSASAQSTKTVRVRVAFDFQVKDKIFPAGEYHIETAGCCASGNVLTIRNPASGKLQMIVPAVQRYANKRQSPKIVFERRADRYFLTEVFFESGKWGFALPVARSKKEKNAASADRREIELPVSN